MPEEHSVISSLIIDCLAEDTQKVAEQLAAIDGVEVHGTDDGQVVITIEKPSLAESHDLANSFVELEGVIGINLIYANFEDDPDIQEKYEAIQAKAAKQHEEK